MSWSEWKYRRGYDAARSFLAKRRHSLADLVNQHENLTAVDEYEVGWRDYTLEALEDADPVHAAWFLLRCNLPASAYQTMEFLYDTDQLVWARHPYISSVVEAYHPDDGQHPVITVDLPARDYTVAEGVLGS